MLNGSWILSKSQPILNKGGHTHTFDDCKDDLSQLDFSDYLFLGGISVCASRYVKISLTWKVTNVT